MASRFVFIAWVLNVDELSVGDILDINPLNLDGAWPLASLLPKVLMVIIHVHPLHHLSNSTEVLRLVYAEKEIDSSILNGLNLF